jgi:hypothetical protein
MADVNITLTECLSACIQYTYAGLQYFTNGYSKIIKIKISKGEGRVESRGKMKKKTKNLLAQMIEI